MSPQSLPPPSLDDWPLLPPQPLATRRKQLKLIIISVFGLPFWCLSFIHLVILIFCFSVWYPGSLPPGLVSIHYHTQTCLESWCEKMVPEFLLQRKLSWGGGQINSCGEESEELKKEMKTFSCAAWGNERNLCFGSWEAWREEQERQRTKVKKRII